MAGWVVTRFVGDVGFGGLGKMMNVPGLFCDAQLLQHPAGCAPILLASITSHQKL